MCVNIILVVYTGHIYIHIRFFQKDHLYSMYIFACEKQAKKILV